ncbi:hypothetical protein EDB86DRAFT_2834402 [Lactarius hatsudake]|nr:hypothetical protein EDB86DRAFT_2834402 [Lactarius hatsudake]
MGEPVRRTEGVPVAGGSTRKRNKHVLVAPETRVAANVGKASLFLTLHFTFPTILPAAIPTTMTPWPCVISTGAADATAYYPIPNQSRTTGDHNGDCDEDEYDLTTAATATIVRR